MLLICLPRSRHVERLALSGFSDLCLPAVFLRLDGVEDTVVAAQFLKPCEK